jgi:DNA-binding FadR family transcriptional regulator
LVKRAFEKLHHQPPQVPHEEHKELHLSIFRRLDNPFVQGVLEAYWLAYEESGLAMYTDLQYLEQVWRYHQKMVEAICSGDLDNGYRIVTEHMDLISQRSKSIIRHRFE